MSDSRTGSAAGRVNKAEFPTLAEATAVWARIAMLSFGGPAGQIAVMHRILVEEKRWLGENGASCMRSTSACCCPGPRRSSSHLYRLAAAPHAGRRDRRRALRAARRDRHHGAELDLRALRQCRPGEALFFGLKAAVLAIVLQAVVRIGRRALKNAPCALAALSFVAIFVFDVPFPAIVLARRLIGFLGAGSGWGLQGRRRPRGRWRAGRRRRDAARREAPDMPGRAGGARCAWRCHLPGALAGADAGAAGPLGPGHVFSDIAVFFSTMAVVTFGGAYAVLAYVAQAAVGTYGWLAPGEMLDGLGMAETTPGPLIMVTQFVGFMGAFRDAAPCPRCWPARWAGCLTTWVTFAPCFLWIFLGAPYIERLRENRALSAALAAVTAAVVGVILNLALWFGLHVLFEEVRVFTGFGMRLDVPVLNTLDPAAAALTLAALVAVFWLRLGLLTVLAASAAAGICLYLLGLVNG
jgi:chromate transporter